MFYINENTPIPDNRYFVFVTDTADLATATANALYKRISFNYKNLSDSTAGFVGNGTTYLSLLQNSGISDAEAKLMVTDIVVLGGNNDRGKGVVASILPAMSTFATYCKQHFPLAKVWVGMTGWADVGVAGSGYINVTMQFRGVLEGYTACGQYGMCYMDNVHYATHKTNFWADTFTMTSAGATWIGGHVAECLLNGSTNVFETATATLTYRSGCSAIESTQVCTSINNNIASLYLRNGTSNVCGFNVPTQYIPSFKYYEPVPIADLTSSWCTGRVTEYTSMKSDWYYALSNGSTALEDKYRLLLQGRTLCIQYYKTYVEYPNATRSVGYAKFNEPIKIIDDALYC